MRAKLKKLVGVLESIVEEAQAALAGEKSTVLPPEPVALVESGVTQPKESGAVPERSVGAPQRRILKALAELEVLGAMSLDRRTAAVFSGQSPRSSAYGNHLASLRAAGLVSYPGEGLLALTEAGRDAAPGPDTPVSLEELQRRWLAYLNPYEGDLLRVLMERYPQALSREALSKASGRSFSSSAFGNAVASLKNLGLVAYPREGHVQATTLLFPEALLEKQGIGSH